MLDIVGVTMEHQPVIDGISLVPLFEGEMESRPRPLGFTWGRYAREDDPESCQPLNAAWIDGRYMLRLDPPTKQRKTESVILYDILADPSQENILPMEGRSLAGGFAAERKEERTLLFEHYGRAAAVRTIATFDAVPGDYVLEVAMTDAHGLTTVTKSVNMKVRGD